MNQNETFDPQAILAEVFEFSPADIAAIVGATYRPHRRRV
jgi:hypothetical protein